jgi:glutathione peroxidase
MLSTRIRPSLLTGLLAVAISLLPSLTQSGAEGADKKGAHVPAALDFNVKDIDGKPVHLGRYAGQVLLLVNVASQCGNTPQYADLQSLYEKYRGKGFAVLGFPSNDFGKQEPGSEQQIKEFCSTKYRVTFPMFSKIVVKGEGQAPLYRYLTDKKTDPAFGGEIEWNFAKFLIGRNGEVVARFPAGKNPGDPEVVKAIEDELARPAPAEKQASKG